MKNEDHVTIAQNATATTGLSVLVVTVSPPGRLMVGTAYQSIHKEVTVSRLGSDSITERVYGQNITIV